MRMYDILQAKKNAEELSDEAIKYFIKGITDGSVPDYQATAFLMAVCLNGMSERETFVLTDEMMRSGELVDLSEFGNNTVDKHSTGGVGDKTTLIVAPIAAACGCKVPKMSGRGLGHTGGTLDKLESIPGFRTELTSEEFSNIVKSCGMAVISQTANIAPADKKLYALRDVTATVDSVPLIASSVMSKKLAAGAKNIVLDVTMGSGAFIKDIDTARSIAQLMVSIGNAAGRNTAAYITNMDVPLGYAIGNSLEVIEAVEILKGADIKDLREICVTLAAGMISLSLNTELAIAERMAIEALDSGRALLQFRRWIHSQGGDTAFINDYSRLPQASVKVEYRALRDGYISSMNTEAVGKASAVLGAGRTIQGESIDLSAGIQLVKKTGSYCTKGNIIAVLHTSSIERAEAAAEVLNSAITFEDSAPDKFPEVFEIIK